MSMHYWKVLMVCNSPVFVGSGEKFMKSQYIYSKDERKVYFLDETGWIRFLNRHGILDDFSSSLLNTPVHFSLFSYISRQRRLQNKYGSVRNILQTMKQEGVVLRIEPFEGNYAKEPKDIHGFTLDVYSKPYIPGSSLKGAFRTAILTHHILQNRRMYRKDWENLKRAAGKKWDMGKAMKELEQRLTIPLNENGNGNMVNSYFRGLSVSDAKLVSGGLCIVPKMDLGLHTDRTHEVSLFREALTLGSKLEFTLGIDDSESAMGHFGIHGFNDFQKILQNFVNFQYEVLKIPFEPYAQDELEDIRHAEYADFILGGGTGYISKTLLYALAPNWEDAVDVVRKLMKALFRNGHHDKDYKISPHTLKLVESNGYRYLMGLCSLEGAEALC